MEYVLKPAIRGICELEKKLQLLESQLSEALKTIEEIKGMELEVSFRESE